MSKHTEGQWELRGEFHTRYVYARGNNISGIVATINLAWPHEAQRDEQLANAHVLAASSDLLAALQRAVDEAVADDLDGWFANARAAILKATGGAS